MKQINKQVNFGLFQVNNLTHKQVMALLRNSGNCVYLQVEYNLNDIGITLITPKFIINFCIFFFF